MAEHFLNAEDIRGLFLMIGELIAFQNRQNKASVLDSCMYWYYGWLALPQP